MISVCMATYNGGRFIRRQMDSILPQLGPDDEVVVSDDGSTDDTLQILRSYGDPRIRIIEGPRRKSPVWNFESALRAARGEYIFLSDQDDWWEHEKVAVSMKYLEDYDCVVSDCLVVDANDEVLIDSFYIQNQTRAGFLYNLCLKNGYLGCCMAFRRHVLERALPFPEDVPMHDIWIGNVAAAFFSVRFIPKRLMHYTRHGDNASTASSPSAYSFTGKLGIRWRVTKALLRRKFR